MNKVLLVGNLGKDPEVRYAQSGTAIANFSLATSDSKKVDGEWKKHTEWHNIVAFGKQAENIGEHLQSGNKVAVEGKLQTSSWEDQQGVKKYKTEVVADRVEFLVTKKETHDAPTPVSDSKPEKNESPEVGELSGKAIIALQNTKAEEEDDLPF